MPLVHFAKIHLIQLLNYTKHAILPMPLVHFAKIHLIQLQPRQMSLFIHPWSSLVEGEGLYLTNCQTNLVIVLYTLSLLFC